MHFPHFHARRAAPWLALFRAATVQATAWTVTSYYELAVTTSTYDSGYTYSFTDTRTIKPKVTPTASAISTYTSVNSLREIKIVEIYLPSNAVPESEILTTTTTQNYYGATVATEWYQPLTYTAPASCPTPFTVSTMTNVYVPSEVTDLLTPTSTKTSTLDRTSKTYTYLTAYLPPSAVPIDTATDYIYTAYIASCRKPYTSSTSGSTASGPSVYDWEVCTIFGCTSLKTWLVGVFSTAGGLFVLGFAENFFWFRRLMRGQRAMRAGTVCWVLISLWVLCFTRTSPARSAEDQDRLRAQWDAMPGRERWRLWWRWGLRRRYPVELLGEDPRCLKPAAAGGVVGVQTGQEVGQGGAKTEATV